MDAGIECVREKKNCIIDQSWLRYMVLFLLSKKASDAASEENNTPNQRPDVFCAIVSSPALLPTQSPLHLHR